MRRGLIFLSFAFYVLATAGIFFSIYEILHGIYPLFSIRFARAIGAHFLIAMLATAFLAWSTKV